MVEVRYVGIAGPGQPHVDCSRRLVEYDLGDHFEPVDQLAGVGHLFVAPFLVLPEYLDHVVVTQLLDELVHC